MEKIRVGASSCLLGQKVRWNGEHKKDQYVSSVLSLYFDWIPVCPEDDLLSSIEDEHRKWMPLIVPVTLIGQYIKKHKIEYLMYQIYLNPSPKELMLQNHV